VCSSGFSLYLGYGKLPAQRIHVRILGHAGRILRSYLHDLCDHGIQACYRGGHGLRIKKIYREPCLAILVPKIVGLLSQLVTNPSRWELNVKFIIWCLPLMMQSTFTPALEPIFFIYIGCATSAPDGVAPEAIVKKLFEYRLKIFFFFNLVMQTIEYISYFPLDFYIHFLFELIVHQVCVQRSRWE
jgi:hypothetical protein